MQVGAIVQARMSSKRCPGKVLHQVNGRPLLWYLISGLRKCTELDGLVIATSNDASDDAVEAFCLSEGVRCHRGDLPDVAGRIRGAVERFGLDAFVRICGDSPLLDYRLVDKAVCLFRESGGDMVSNIVHRTFPKGQSVEVVSAGAYRKAIGLMASADDREHVTKVFYSHPDEFSIREMLSGGRFGDVRHVVDTPEDMRWFEGFISSMDKPHTEYAWRDIVALSDSGGGVAC